jgi:prevent-host-death family protein
MSQFNLAEAKAHFSELVPSAMRGEEVIAANENTPVVGIVPITPALRRPGTGKGVRIPTDFDEPLDDFEGSR